MIIFFFMGFLIAEFGLTKNIDHLVDLLIIPGATLAAAFGGARYAFHLHETKERLAYDRANVKAANGTILRLLFLRNRLSNYQMQVIDPVRDQDVPFLRIQPTQEMPRQAFDLDVESLSFLFEEDTNWLGEIHICISKFQASIDAINLRSKVHWDEIQPRLEDAGLGQGGTMAITDIRKTLGEKNYASILGLTTQAIELVDNSITFVDTTIRKLSRQVKLIYPTWKVLKLGEKPTQA